MYYSPVVLFFTSCTHFWVIHSCVIPFSLLSPHHGNKPSLHYLWAQNVNKFTIPNKLSQIKCLSHNTEKDSCLSIFIIYFVSCHKFTGNVYENFHHSLGCGKWSWHKWYEKDILIEKNSIKGRISRRRTIESKKWSKTVWKSMKSPVFIYATDREHAKKVLTKLLELLGSPANYLSFCGTKTVQ